jgi:hypothetical protein
LLGPPVGPALLRCGSRSRGHEAVLYAFDLIEHDGEDLHDLPLIERKRRLAKLIDRPTPRRAARVWRAPASADSGRSGTSCRPLSYEGLHMRPARAQMRANICTSFNVEPAAGEGFSKWMRIKTSPNYCCKSRKSNNPKNLAKVDLWTSLLLRRFSAPLRRSTVDLG